MNAEPGLITLLLSKLKIRVEEARRVKEADFWGRIAPSKRDLPAFWSIGAHGQPFNDERLTQGTSMHWKTLQHPPLHPKKCPVFGPATECNLVLRQYVLHKENSLTRIKQDEVCSISQPALPDGFKQTEVQLQDYQVVACRSLETGKRLYKSDFTPSHVKNLESAPDLVDAERELVISRLPPHQQIFAFRNCLDRNMLDRSCEPWTQAVSPELDAEAWWSNREQCIRSAVLKILSWMKLHLRYLSEKVK